MSDEVSHNHPFTVWPWQCSELVVCEKDGVRIVVRVVATIGSLKPRLLGSLLVGTDPAT